MDDVYLDRQDPAVTVGLRLSAPGSDLDGALALVWTTTPWTLPSNLAMAVNPDVDYALVEANGERYVLAAARLGALRPGAGGGAAACCGPSAARSCSACPTRRRSTSSSAGRTPTTCWPPTTSPPRTAPASSTSRRRSARRTRSSPTRRASRSVVPVGTDGTFDATVPPVRGHARLRRQPPDHPRPARSATKPFVLGVLLRHETYDHPYPHCWRCGNPLIQRAVDSWFVQVTAFRDRMVELNREITWVPAHIRDGQFGKWLEGAHRLVDLPQPVLGLADPGVDERRPGLPARGRLRLARRARARLRRAAHRPAPAVRRRPHPAQPGRPDRSLDHAPGAGGAGLLVRVGLHAVRAGALPVRERRVVRAPLPGRLHRRVQRPDPRLVLHAARAGHGAVRPAVVPLLRRPRHRAGRRRAEDVEVAQELPRRQRGVRPRRLRRHALVPHGLADPARAAT